MGFEDKMVDYNDKGIDCFVWHEELKIYIKSKINILMIYFIATAQYTQFKLQDKIEYNNLIKSEVDYNKLESDVMVAKQTAAVL